MNFLSTVINGSEVQQAASTVTETSKATASGLLFGGSGVMGIVVYFVVLIAIFYFIGIRPQKKREKQLNDLISNISIGDWVVLDSGFYGKITDSTDQVFMVEFGINKGVIIPVMKQRVIAKADPSVINNQ